MSENTVLYEAFGSVAKLTLNRPQALNSFTRRMHHDLWAALDAAEADAQIRALVITGVFVLAQIWLNSILQRAPIWSSAQILDR